MGTWIERAIKTKISAVNNKMLISIMFFVSTLELIPVLAGCSCLQLIYSYFKNSWNFYSYLLLGKMNPFWPLYFIEIGWLLPATSKRQRVSSGEHPNKIGCAFLLSFCCPFHTPCIEKVGLTLGIWALMKRSWLVRVYVGLYYPVIMELI